ncbi:hypothetical protein C8Q80DRAFT_1267121 [Daedaleopsis nitida]|nr:hypothetical protein C8Q80DRAFT_1267121 [Daedaleopsis nitida]
MHSNKTPHPISHSAKPTVANSTKGRMVRATDAKPLTIPLAKLSTDGSKCLYKARISTEEFATLDGQSSTGSTPDSVNPPPGFPLTSVEVNTTSPNQTQNAGVPFNTTLSDTHQDGAYSVAGLPVLETFIAKENLPDDLFVYDPENISTLCSDRPMAPVRYVRVNPALDKDKRQISYPTRPVEDEGRRSATLHLSPANLTAIGGHSCVFAAPLTLARASQSHRVVAKIPLPSCGAHFQLHQEARMYDSFPEKLMDSGVGDLSADTRRRLSKQLYIEPVAAAGAAEPSPVEVDGEKESSKGGPVKKMWRAITKKVKTAGLKASLKDDSEEALGLHAGKDKDEQREMEKVEVPPAVPKFYGYYLPYVPGTEYVANDCGGDGDHDVDWPSPILLIEDCGAPVRLSDLSHADKMHCMMLLQFLHEAGYIHGCPNPSKILVKPGPLSAPPAQRSLEEPSFRITDFGCGEGWNLVSGGWFKEQFSALSDDDYECMWVPFGFADGVPDSDDSPSEYAFYSDSDDSSSGVGFY